MGTIHQLPVIKAGQTVFDIPDPDADVHEAVVERIEAARLRRLVRGLPPLERHVITWKYAIGGVAGLSCDQIAERLGVSAEAVDTIEQRALESLRNSGALQLAS